MLNGSELEINKQYQVVKRYNAIVHLGWKTKQRNNDEKEIQKHMLTCNKKGVVQEIN